MDRILIIGGSGRIGRSVATDLLSYTDAQLTLTGRSIHSPSPLRSREIYQSLALSQETALRQAIQEHDLVVHCAGPFRHRNHQVLQVCIAEGKPYLDVADSPDYIRTALTYHSSAQEKGAIAIVGAGVSPGISCSLARQGIEALDRANKVQLRYLVAGSGGAGVTIMRTTFNELQTPFVSKIQGQWQTLQPYTEGEVVEWPKFGRGKVYWFNTVEALTLAASFPELQTIITKFGSVPHLYNRLTEWVAQLPKAWLCNAAVVEFLAQASYRMTQVSDPLTGVGLEMVLTVSGIKDGQPAAYQTYFHSPDTARAAGQGVGSIVQLLLQNQLCQPGVWTVEQALSTSDFTAMMQVRGLHVESTWI